MDSLTPRAEDLRAAIAAPWRVLIVDDHPFYRDGLRALFEKQSGVIVDGEAESEQEALRHILAAKPDLVTVDVSLASGNGLSLISAVKQLKSPPQTLVISMYEDRAYADLAIAAGACGYLCKHTEGRELRLALEAIRRGDIYVSPRVCRSALRTQAAPPRSGGPSSEKQLSSRELQIFTLIGQGRNTHQIAAELFIAVSTVETYRERLKTKLNLSSGSELARHAFFWAMQRRSNLD
jgi:DNA-binding NarL/FixJ family response regulator